MLSYGTGCTPKTRQEADDTAGGGGEDAWHALDWLARCPSTRRAPKRRARPVDGRGRRSGHARPDHGRARYDDRQRRTPHPREGHACLAGHRPVDIDRLPAVAGGGDPDLGLGNRALRVEVDLDRLDRAVRRRLGTLLARDLGRRADRVPCPAGPWGRDARAGRLHAGRAERRASARWTSVRADRRADSAWAHLRA